MDPDKKIVSEYDQEIPQSQTADNPLAPRGRAAQPSRDTRKTNRAKQPALSSPSRCFNARVDIKYRTTKHRTKRCSQWRNLARIQTVCKQLKISCGFSKTICQSRFYDFCGVIHIPQTSKLAHWQTIVTHQMKQHVLHFSCVYTVNINTIMGRKTHHNVIILTGNPFILLFLHLFVPVISYTSVHAREYTFSIQFPRAL